MTDKDRIAREILAAEIDRRQDELLELEATYERMGGTFDPPEAEPKQKLLTGPKAKPAKKKKRKSKTAPPPVARRATATFTINGKSIEMSERHRNLLEVIQAGVSEPVPKSDLAILFGKAVPNWDKTKKIINAKLAVAGIQVVNVHGQGWKLEKVPA